MRSWKCRSWGSAGSGPKHFPTLIDLGCGTGMTAVPFRAMADTIVGVDLAPRMLRIAAERRTGDGRKVYDELNQQEVV